VAKQGNGRRILPTSTYRARRVLLHAVSKSTTWDRRLRFPSEGRRAADFITLKIITVPLFIQIPNLKLDWKCTDVRSFFCFCVSEACQNLPYIFEYYFCPNVIPKCQSYELGGPTTSFCFINT
jgi:hypothetical protein